MGSATFSSGGAGSGGQPAFPDAIFRIKSVSTAAVTHTVTAGRYAIVKIQGHLHFAAQTATAGVHASIDGDRVFSITTNTVSGKTDTINSTSSQEYIADAGEIISIAGVTAGGSGKGEIHAEIWEYAK